MENNKPSIDLLPNPIARTLSNEISLLKCPALKPLALEHWYGISLKAIGKSELMTSIDCAL